MRIEWNLWIDDTRGASITGSNDSPLQISQNGTLSGAEHAAVACVVQVANCLLRGQDIHAYFNPTTTPEEEEEIVRCQWMRSGKLVMLGSARKAYMHAINANEAMCRKRIFTCTRSLFNALPKRRLGSVAITKVRKEPKHAKASEIQDDGERGENRIHDSTRPETGDGHTAVHEECGRQDARTGNTDDDGNLLDG